MVQAEVASFSRSCQDKSVGTVYAIISDKGILMPKFGTRSLNNLKSVHPNLLAVASSAIQRIDFTVICTVRDKADQEQAYSLKRSKAHFGQSPHNYFPSLAFDFIPYPFTDVDWDDTARFKAIAAVLKDCAHDLGFKCTWGGDFVSFKDTPHFELQHWRDYLGHEYVDYTGISAKHGIVEPYIKQ